MAKFKCIVCGNGSGLSQESFYHGMQELVNTVNWCNNCNAETEWADMGNFGETPKIKFHDLNNIINVFSEHVQKRYKTSPDWDEILKINRVGGEDHRPVFEVTVSYEGKTTAKHYQAAKKEVKKLAIKEWLDKYEDEVFI